LDAPAIANCELGSRLDFPALRYQPKPVVHAVAITMHEADPRFRKEHGAGSGCTISTAFIRTNSVKSSLRQKLTFRQYTVGTDDQTRPACFCFCAWRF
jgi:hypothetical protein